MAQQKLIGKELCAGEVMICRKCSAHFEPTINPKNHKPYAWCKECRSLLFNRRGKKDKQSNKCEVASSISEEVEISECEEASNSCDVADDVSDVCVTDNPNSITGKLNAILSTLEECPHADHTVDTTDISERLDKLEKLLQKQYAILKRLL